MRSYRPNLYLVTLLALCGAAQSWYSMNSVDTKHYSMDTDNNYVIPGHLLELDPFTMGHTELHRSVWLTPRPANFTAPNIDPKAPGMDPKAPTMDPKAPNIDPNAPITDPNAPITDPNAPITDSTAPTMGPNAPSPSEPSPDAAPSANSPPSGNPIQPGTPGSQPKAPSPSKSASPKSDNPWPLPKTSSPSSNGGIPSQSPISLPKSDNPPSNPIPGATSSPNSPDSEQPGPSGNLPKSSNQVPFPNGVNPVTAPSSGKPSSFPKSNDLPAPTPIPSDSPKSGNPAPSPNFNMPAPSPQLKVPSPKFNSPVPASSPKFEGPVPSPSSNNPAASEAQSEIPSPKSNIPVPVPIPKSEGPTPSPSFNNPVVPLPQSGNPSSKSDNPSSSPKSDNPVAFPKSGNPLAQPDMPAISGESVSSAKSANSSSPNSGGAGLSPTQPQSASSKPISVPTSARSMKPHSHSVWKMPSGQPGTPRGSAVHTPNSDSPDYNSAFSQPVVPEGTLPSAASPTPSITLPPPVPLMSIISSPPMPITAPSPLPADPLQRLYQIQHSPMSPAPSSSAAPTPSIPAPRILKKAAKPKKKSPLVSLAPTSAPSINVSTTPSPALKPSTKTSKPEKNSPHREASSQQSSLEQLSSQSSASSLSEASYSSNSSWPWSSSMTSTPQNITTRPRSTPRSKSKSASASNFCGNVLCSETFAHPAPSSGSNSSSSNSNSSRPSSKAPTRPKQSTNQTLSTPSSVQNSSHKASSSSSRSNSSWSHSSNSASLSKSKSVPDSAVNVSRPASSRSNATQSSGRGSRSKRDSNEAQNNPESADGYVTHWSPVTPPPTTAKPVLAPSPSKTAHNSTDGNHAAVVDGPKRRKNSDLPKATADKPFQFRGNGTDHVAAKFPTPRRNASVPVTATSTTKSTPAPDEHRVEKSDHDSNRLISSQSMAEFIRAPFVPAPVFAPTPRPAPTPALVSPTTTVPAAGPVVSTDSDRVSPESSKTSQAQRPRSTARPDQESPTKKSSLTSVYVQTPDETSRSNSESSEGRRSAKKSGIYEPRPRSKVAADSAPDDDSDTYDFSAAPFDGDQWAELAALEMEIHSEAPDSSMISDDLTVTSAAEVLNEPVRTSPWPSPRVVQFNLAGSASYRDQQSSEELTPKPSSDSETVPASAKTYGAPRSETVTDGEAAPELSEDDDEAPPMTSTPATTAPKKSGTPPSPSLPKKPATVVRNQTEPIIGYEAPDKVIVAFSVAPSKKPGTPPSPSLPKSTTDGEADSHQPMEDDADTESSESETTPPPALKILSGSTNEMKPSPRTYTRPQTPKPTESVPESADEPIQESQSKPTPKPVHIALNFNDQKPKADAAKPTVVSKSEPVDDSSEECSEDAVPVVTKWSTPSPLLKRRSASGSTASGVNRSTPAAAMSNQDLIQRRVAELSERRRKITARLQQPIN